MVVVPFAVVAAALVGSLGLLGARVRLTTGLPSGPSAFSVALRTLLAFPSVEGAAAPLPLPFVSWLVMFCNACVAAAVYWYAEVAEATFPPSSPKRGKREATWMLSADRGGESAGGVEMTDEALCSDAAAGASCSPKSRGISIAVKCTIPRQEGDDV